MKLLLPSLFAVLSSGLEHLPERARGGLAAKMSPELLPSNTFASASHTIDLPLDHMNPLMGTFPVRYYVDDRHFDARGEGPIFMHMGGEGPARGVQAGPREKKFKALAVGIEHRYYGQSIPNNRSVEGLKYLSVEQNLADTMALIDYLQTKYGDKSRVAVTFGGSYSGATSAWMRVTYPDKITAAYSTSGVVNAILDFPQFDSLVGQALLSPVSASPNCADRLRSVTEALERGFALSEDSKNQIKRQFKASNLVGTLHGDTDFWYMVADGAAMADQYGYKKLLCEALPGNNGTDASRIAAMAKFIQTQWGQDYGSGCFYDSECLKDLTETGMDRSWRWQKCTQLAYLQSAPENLSVRSKALTIDVLLDQCEYVFGDGVKPDSVAFNDKFGADDPDSSNIVFLNFSDDPWQKASVNHTLSDSLIHCLTTCDGCGHCGAGVSTSQGAKCEGTATDYLGKWIEEAQQKKRSQ